MKVGKLGKGQNCLGHMGHRQSVKNFFSRKRGNSGATISFLNAGDEVFFRRHFFPNKSGMLQIFENQDFFSLNTLNIKSGFHNCFQGWF